MALFLIYVLLKADLACNRDNVTQEISWFCTDSVENLSTLSTYTVAVKRTAAVA